MRVKVKLIADYQSFKAGEILNPSSWLAQQLIEKKQAVSLEKPAEKKQPSQPAQKKVESEK